VAVFLIRQKKEEIRRTEQAKEKEAKTITEVLKNLTAPVSLKESVVSQEIIQKLTAPQTKKSQVKKEVLESLTAP